MRDLRTQGMTHSDESLGLVASYVPDLELRKQKPRHANRQRPKKKAQQKPMFYSKRTRKWVT